MSNIRAIVRLVRLLRIGEKTLAFTLVLSVFSGSMPVEAFVALSQSDSNIVDEMYLARHDPNVVDSFLTIDETIEELRSRKANESASALERPSDGANENEGVEPEVEFLGSGGIQWSNSGSIPSQSHLGESVSQFIKPVVSALVPWHIEPSIHLRTPELHPKKGEVWLVKFETEGISTLTIRPLDISTVQDDEFVSLYCGAEERMPKIIEGDTLVFEDWYCNDIAYVSHMTLKEGNHALSFTFGKKTVVARNGPNSAQVLGFFKNGITAATFAGDASISARQPDPAPGDLMVAVVALRPRTSTLTTPAGWTSLGSIDGSDGAAEGADTGTVRVYTMYKVADGTEGTANLTISEGGTTSVWGAVIYKLRSASGTYDIATSSYAVNGDVTAWGQTLPNVNTGFQSGDLALIAQGQVGNVATGFSAWNITATGVNLWGTVTEIFDSNSSTGNDIQMGGATTYVRSGTAYAAPATTLTASAAASGAVTVLRIRQGAGNNRSDTFVRSCGLSAAGTTSVVPGYPEHEVGDLLVLLVEVRNSTVTPTNPANWTDRGNYTGGSGTFGIDAGNAKIQAWTRHASSTVGVLTGTLTVTLTSGSTAVGVICSVHREGLPDSSAAWSVDVDGGSDNSAGTSWSVTGSGIDLTANDGGDAVIVASGINTDTYTYSAHALSASGITFQDVFEDNRMLTANGNDSGLNVAHGYVTSGSATNVAPTFTMTSSGTTTNIPAGASIILALHGNPSSETQRNVRLISTTIKLLEGTRFTIY